MASSNCKAWGYTFLWTLVLLVFWFIAFCCAFLWVALIPFQACLDCGPVLEFLQHGMEMPRDLGVKIKAGSPW